MATICFYKQLIKGPKDVCYAFARSNPFPITKLEILRAEGTDEAFEILLQGDARWHVDAYCERHWKGEYPVVPAGYAEQGSFGDPFAGKIRNYTMKERSLLLDLEVYCSAVDSTNLPIAEEEFDEEKKGYTYEEELEDFREEIQNWHFKAGTEVPDDFPEELILTAEEVPAKGHEPQLDEDPR